MQLADFTFRYEYEISDALHKGSVIIADRYIHTAVVRGKIRGIPEEYIKEVYGFARKPDINILLDIPAKDTIKRNLPKSDKIWKIGMGSVKDDEELDIDGYIEYLEKSRQIYLDLAIKDNAIIYDSKNTQENILYDRWIQVMLTYVVPIAFINFYPAQYFLKKDDFLGFNPILVYLSPIVRIS